MRHEPVTASNGRGYGPEINGVNSGATGTMPAEVSKMLKSGPRDAASELRTLGMIGDHLPVSSRFSSVPTAVMVSAGVKAQ